jgi:two-component system, LuxR family, response regulator FixJ
MDQPLIAWGQSRRGVRPANEIFVVDDDENMRDLLEASLAPEGFLVTGFADGDSFLQAAGNRLPLCVFLDVVMPRRSGIEVLKDLRARQYSAPIILMSARADVPTVVEAMRNGAHDYIQKPFDRTVPVLRARGAVEMRSDHQLKASAPVLLPSEASEWCLLSPSERDALSLMRMVDAGCR